MTTLLTSGLTMPNEFPRRQPNKQFAFPKHVQNKSCTISRQLMKSLCFVLIYSSSPACIESKVTLTNAYEIFNILYSLTQELIELQQNSYTVVRKKWSRISSGVTHRSTCVLRISKDVMLDVSTGSSPEFRSFISQDPIASSMENVALSLRLLNELVLWSNSNYYRYIRSLPISYQTFMDMTPDDLKHLRGSTVLETLVCNFLFICRQYAYFFNRFQDKTGLQITRSFCFEDYRWAVSSVMSRNNLIPKGDEGAKKMCMIPIWDMINHKTGRVTTDFNPESGELIFYAMESTKPGDQIFMDYGARTSAEFLLFSGFVPAHNPHNHVRVTFGKHHPLIHCLFTVYHKLVDHG
ncbi:hypothetical protein PHET_07932 [Paragonimus heterotremus]|uniref:protein-histidine N-methyltransferase n=1 Tax=Paragonimus heterotremus TaxID=100268 RepID=A0A8J4TEH2_9TREM|nr:hypothetical protein PHET_07932 [Paragonimus heterotremus]